MKKPMPMKPDKMKMRFGKPVAKAADGGMMARSSMPATGGALPMPRGGIKKGTFTNAKPIVGKVPQTGGGGATYTNKLPAMRKGGSVEAGGMGGSAGSGGMGKPGKGGGKGNGGSGSGKGNGGGKNLGLGFGSSFPMPGGGNMGLGLRRGGKVSKGKC